VHKYPRVFPCGLLLRGDSHRISTKSSWCREPIITPLPLLSASTICPSLVSGWRAPMETLNVEISGDDDSFHLHTLWDVGLDPPCTFSNALIYSVCAVAQFLKVFYLTVFSVMPQARNLSGSPPTVPPDPQYLNAEPSHRDRLKREAEGLFAGITLLNEMEPLEDIDEPNVGRSHDKTNTTQVFKKFLSQLRPAYSGEGIYCPYCILRSFSGDGFPCTSRDIQDHFWLCRFLLGLRVAVEPFYEAFEAFLEQLESKNHIENLQQQCKIIQDGLHSLPDIDDFLCQLEYLPDGKVKCQRPECANLDGFKPYSSSIKTHFVLYHCANFEGALWWKTSEKIASSIESQMQRPKTASIMAKMLENVQIGIPIAHRISDLTYPRLKYPSETKGLSIAHSLEKKPSWEQLQVLRTLRAKFIVHHRRFLQRTASSCSDGLQEFRRSCRRYADLLDTGLLTFKAIMNSESPLSVKEIFAFISLSYAMVGAMQAKGKPVNFCLDKDEMQRWRGSFLTRKDLDTFDELVPLLWPELNTYQEESFSDFWNSSDRFYYKALIEGGFSPLHYTAERLLEESSSDESFCFDDWLNFPNTDTSPFQRRKSDLAGSPHDTSWMRSPEIQPPPHSHSCHGNPSSPSEMQHDNSSEDRTTSEQLRCLAHTVIFMQAISFLICEISRTSY
jgi:hypothetical protein